MVDAELHLVAAESADSLMLAMLTLFNESDDTEGAVQKSLDMLTTALGGRIGEIWMVGGAPRQVELRYSSSGGSHGATAFAAAGRSLAPNAIPALVSGVLRTGRGSTAEVTNAEGPAERGDEAAAAGIRSAMAFPIRTGGGLAGVLVVHRETVERPARGVVDAIPLACHHMGRFLERVSADDAIHESVQELSALASTDSLTGLNNRREFDRALRTIPREPFAILSVDVDCLKDVNDAHGHAAGDALLRLVGNTLGLLVRGWDVMARVGGDEFAALLPGVGVFGAALVAERMRVAMHSLVLPTGPVRITAGWSAAPGGPTRCPSGTGLTRASTRRSTRVAIWSWAAPTNAVRPVTSRTGRIPTWSRASSRAALSPPCSNPS
ncbi:MAG TPA: GGDEF domain-containing protein [Candidatus Dormibacteraeota bacterium]